MMSAVAVRCLVCALWVEADPHAWEKCIAKHAPGECCHVGAFLDDHEGHRIRGIPWANCIIVPIVECTELWLPDERSNEAVGCDCPQDAIATVRRVVRATHTNVVLHCRHCGDARVIREAPQ